MNGRIEYWKEPANSNFRPVSRLVCNSEATDRQTSNCKPETRLEF